MRCPGNARCLRGIASIRRIKIGYFPEDLHQFTYGPTGACAKIVESTADGTVTSTKQFVGGEIRDASSSVLNRLFAQGETIGGSDYFFTQDTLGSVRELIDSSGNVKTSYSYDPWGRATQTQISGSLSSDVQYAHYYLHGPSGLDLTMFRAYSPSLGRWLSRDPMGESVGTSLFAYVGDDPISFSDPLGLRYSQPGDPTEGTVDLSPEIHSTVVSSIVTGAIGGAVLGALGKALGRTPAIAKLLRPLTRAPGAAVRPSCGKATPRIGDFPQWVRDLLPEIWKGETPVDALPMNYRQQLADMYSDVAGKYPDSPQGALNQARADYLLGTGPNPGPNVSPFAGGGPAPPLR